MQYKKEKRVFHLVLTAPEIPRKGETKMEALSLLLYQENVSDLKKFCAVKIIEKVCLISSWSGRG